jgi:AcrR family transcriptional regulator
MTAAARKAGSARARQTRRRIVEAATELFLEQGYVETTVAAIAARAGVAVQTLYLGFGSKYGVLHAAFDLAVAGDDEPLAVRDRTPFSALDTEHDAGAALQRLVHASADIVERVAPLFGVVQQSAADPEPAQLLATSKRERYEVQLAAIQAIAALPGFTPHLDVEQAAQICWALLSEESYLLFVRDQGWSPLAWRRWAASTCAQQLLSAQAAELRG